MENKKRYNIFLYWKPSRIDLQSDCVNQKKFIFSFENDIDQDGTIDSIEVTASPYDPYNMFENK